ncbi:1-acyl-sn-glycerol-3-phosphate acyltransferase [Schleiferiaceae bacterium]|jgi:1-acyl-sn-glycerol-3-phosphate acyltransferase|nr:1-acyl-sn-glycerol-3-phosphate acyltransferase [Schleiferiaceae bacterium]
MPTQTPPSLLKFPRVVFGIFYHIWYYALMILSIVGLFPPLFWTSRKVESFPRFYRYARLWAAWILNGMGLIRKVTYDERISWDRTYIVVANHSSEIDIMFSYRIVKSPTVFIGKAELARIPLFGFFFRRSSIPVDRNSLASKRQVMDKAARRLERGSGLCIYPEGGIPKDPTVLLAPFKSGAFKLAIESGNPILPITFANNRRHFPEFLQGGGPGLLRAHVHAPIEVSGMTLSDQDALSDRVYALLLNQLKAFGRTE